MSPSHAKAVSCPIVVSFSGIDGAGKSTQIALLREHFIADGARVSQFAFWDDVVVLARYREIGALKAFRGEKGVGAPDKPVRRRDKNVRTWYMTGLRMFFYLLDAANLNRVMARATSGDVDLVMFDRYLYDELANLPLAKPAIRAYVRWLLKWVRRPDVAFVLDASPEAACERKPEYPLDFVRGQRELYCSMPRLAREVAVIAPGPVTAVHQRIVDELHAKAPRSKFVAQSANPASVGVQQAV